MKFFFVAVLVSSILMLSNSNQEAKAASSGEVAMTIGASIGTILLVEASQMSSMQNHEYNEAIGQEVLDYLILTPAEREEVILGPILQSYIDLGLEENPEKDVAEIFEDLLESSIN
ncbi:MAG: hypothetical protein HOE90_10350 [Bacteriovoracaceae bacterium]|jgi:hypothetical protein|nr:hypothetical protein [Bacteriovoracaceae bacterium]